MLGFVKSRPERNSGLHVMVSGSPDWHQYGVLHYVAKAWFRRRLKHQGSSENTILNMLVPKRSFREKDPLSRARSTLSRQTHFCGSNMRSRGPIGSAISFGPRFLVGPSKERTCRSSCPGCCEC